MRHPYREPPPSVDAELDDDEHVIYALSAAVGAIPIAIAIAHGERFGVAATVGLLMFGIGVGGLLASVRRR